MIRRASLGASLFVIASLFAAADVAAQSGPPTGEAAGQAGPRPRDRETTTTKPARRRSRAASRRPSRRPTASDAAPVIVVETERGTFEFETFPKEAPKTVAHIVALVKRNFYNGQRIHRVRTWFRHPVRRSEYERLHQAGALGNRRQRQADRRRRDASGASAQGRCGGDGARRRPARRRFADVCRLVELSARGRSTAGTPSSVR